MFTNALATFVLVLHYSHVRGQNERPDFRSRCSTGQVAFRRKSVAASSNFGNFLNSTSFSEIDCAVKCYQKVSGCEAVRFDKKEKLCLYGKYSPDICPQKNASPRIEQERFVADEGPGKITIMYCIQCLGSDRVSPDASRIAPSPLFKSVDVEQLALPPPPPLRRNSKTVPDLAAFLQKELKASKDGSLSSRNVEAINLDTKFGLKTNSFEPSIRPKFDNIEEIQEKRKTIRTVDFEQSVPTKEIYVPDSTVVESSTAASGSASTESRDSSQVTPILRIIAGGNDTKDNRLEILKPVDSANSILSSETKIQIDQGSLTFLEGNASLVSASPANATVQISKEFNATGSSIQSDDNLNATTDPFNVSESSLLTSKDLELSTISRIEQQNQSIILIPAENLQNPSLPISNGSEQVALNENEKNSIDLPPAPSASKLKLILNPADLLNRNETVQIGDIPFASTGILPSNISLKIAGEPSNANSTQIPEEENQEQIDPTCEESLLYPCLKNFGRDCIVIKPQRCPLCFCPQFSPAKGCAGPNGLSLENQVDLLRGRKLCPDGSRARTVYRFLRRVDKAANFDDCYRTVQPDCGAEQDLYWKMPRFLNDCYYYCYSDGELRARGIANLTTFD